MFEDNERTVKQMLETWVNRNDGCFVSSYNFIDKESSNKYKISTNEKDCNGELFMGCLYEVWINDIECRIVEIIK